MLTMLQYKILRSYGFHSEMQSFPAKQISTPEAFLALSPSIKARALNQSYSLTVVGILDTHFNEGRYQKINQEKEQVKDGYTSLLSIALNEELAAGNYVTENASQPEKTTMSLFAVPKATTTISFLSIQA